jgi:hypothetical protein
MKLRLPVALAFALLATSTPGQAVAPAVTPAVTIVLPPRLLANAPATLAVLGADGHLIPGLVVDIGNGQHVTTDATGRATFTAPRTGALIATTSGVSAAALIDAAAPRIMPAIPTVPPAVSQHDRFAICGGGFHGDVNTDKVTINGDAAFVMAASPVCLVVLPESRTMAGPAKIEMGAGHAPAATSLVALDFTPPNPPLEPGKKGKLFVRAEGTPAPLEIAVENRSPEVIHFTRGETQQLRTSGGAQNQAPVDAQAIRSGDFSLHARIIPAPDPSSAVRYLQAAEGVAPKNLQSQLKAIETRISRHPGDAEKERPALDRVAKAVPAADLQVLIQAARGCL